MASSSRMRLQLEFSRVWLQTVLASDVIGILVVTLPSCFGSFAEVGSSRGPLSSPAWLSQCPCSPLASLLLNFSSIPKAAFPEVFVLVALSWTFSINRKLSLVYFNP